MMELRQGYKQSVAPNYGNLFAVASPLSVNLITHLKLLCMSSLEICCCLQIIDADADRAMLAYYFRRQEEHKVGCNIACSAPGSDASVYAITVCTRLLALPLAEYIGS